MRDLVRRHAGRAAHRSRAWSGQRTQGEFSCALAVQELRGPTKTNASAHTRTCDRPLHYRPILQLEDHRLVTQLHEEASELHGGCLAAVASAQR